MTKTNESIVIVGAARTPTGAFQGTLKALTTPELGSIAIKGALDNAHIDVGQIDEVIMGCVLPAGLGQAPARQAALKAGVSIHTPCMTVNKVCGSGLKATMLGADALKLNQANRIITGGMESMTNAPYILEKARFGYRFGHGQISDHMALDGLEDAYERGRAMGTFAEDTAQKYGFSREQQDKFAINSVNKARKAQEAGLFDAEITSVVTDKGKTTVTQDEPPQKAMPEKVPSLKPAFREGGTITAASSSSLADGAAALVLMREQDAKAENNTIRAKICGYESYSHEPQWFTTAPIGAVEKLLKSLNWSAQDVDAWEINEAFAVVTMAATKDLGIDPQKVNMYGGACALGHPIGCSGARILITLLNILEKNNLKRGIATACIGGGEAVALAIERP